MIQRSRKHIKSSAASAMLWASVGVVGAIITEVSGYHKSKPQPTPKPFSEVMQSWPVFIALGLLAFIVIFFFKLREKEQINKICPKCETVSSISAEIDNAKCVTCKVPLEDLEGYYERHSKT